MTPDYDLIILTLMASDVTTVIISPIYQEARPQVRNPSFEARIVAKSVLEW